MDFRAICIVIGLFLTCVSAMAGEAVNDVRVLIDTSGSMKKTDPKNLRVPSLKLLVNLLPADSKTGVWLFDAAPELLVSPEKITPQSKNAILKMANKIHSRGLYTDIEAAMRAATQNWTGAPSEGEKRTLVLLTDGMVDLPSGTEASTGSRQRILTELLPKMQAAGINIHTIGLSEQSDRALLQQMSLATSGSTEIVHDAQELQRSFVRIFNRVIPQTTLPLKDNQFNVDSSIEEFTVLINLKPDAHPSQLIDSSGNKINQTHKPDSVRWVHEAGYDLVTVEHPAPGKWKLEADVDPGNQVMVVTHLKMEVTPIPAQLMKGELPDILASFSENGQIIERKDFLDLITVGSQLTEGIMNLDNPLTRSETNPTQFRLHFELQPEVGKHTLTITADGKTFQRQSVQNFILLEDWVTVLETEDHESEPAQLLISLLPSSTALLANSLSAHAHLTHQNGETRELEPNHSSGNVIFAVPLPQPEDHWIVNFTATAKMPNGTKIDVPLKPIKIDGKSSVPPLSNDAAAQTAPPVPKQQDHTDTEAHPIPIPPTAPEAPPADTQNVLSSIFAEANWIVTAAVTLGINLIIAGAWFWAYRMMRKRQETIITNLLSKLSPTTSPNI